MIGHSYGSTVVGEAAYQGDGLAVTDIVVAGSWVGGLPLDHDNEPTDADFGANRYHVDTSGHSGYWNDKSVSLSNQAAIVVGRYAAVSLDHGALPP